MKKIKFLVIQVNLTLTYWFYEDSNEAKCRN